MDLMPDWSEVSSGYTKYRQQSGPYPYTTLLVSVGTRGEEALQPYSTLLPA